jgi:imidazolonepropionase-like amidohydrolase
MTRQTLLPDRIFDSIGGKMLEGHAVVIADDRIEAVVPAARTPDAAPLPGMTVIPGLIDVHTHLIGLVDEGQGYSHLVMRSGAQEALIGVKHAAATLRSGFTTVRDIGTFRAFADVALKEAIEGGWIAGPRMMVAGAYVTCPGGGGDITGLAVDVDAVLPRDLRFGVTSGVDEMRANVRQILRYGADFIKVLATGAVLTSGTDPGAPEFTEDELRAAVETAASGGTHVAAHAHGAEGIKRAVRAGVRSIEHGSMIDEEGIDLMVRHGTYLVADLYDGDHIQQVGPSLGYSDEVLAKTEMTTQAQRDGFRAAVAAGVRIAFGTDSGVYPHGENARQFQLYVDHGLSPASALQSATRWAAEMMGWEDRVGSLTAGTYADLLVVAGDPTNDIGTLLQPQGVMKGGVWVTDPGDELQQRP